MSHSPKQLQNAKVSVFNLNSTGAISALGVVQLDSTGGLVTGGAGGSTQVSVKEILTSSGASVMDSTEGAIKVNVVAGAAGGSTEVTIRQSTATDLNAAVVQGSTIWPVQVSTGSVRVSQSTATDLLARVNQGVGNSSVGDRWRVNAANSSAQDYIPVRISNGSTYLETGTEYVDGSTVSTLAGPGLAFNNSSNDTFRVVGVNQPLPVQLRTSSGASAMDSTEGALKVNVVAGAAGGSTIFTVSTGSINVAGVLDSSNALVKPGDSDNNALRVNVVAGAAGGSTLATVRQSTIGDLKAAVYQSTAADLNVSAVQGSTVWVTQVSSVAGRVSVGDYSTGAPGVGSSGLHVRQVFPTLLSTTVVITSTNSTAIYPLISSAAGLRHKVYAYFVGSTHTNPSTLLFCSSASASGFDHWPVNFGSGSSGVTGANLAVTPPGYIFAGIVANALNVKIEGGSSAASTVIVRIGISYFSEA